MRLDAYDAEVHQEALLFADGVKKETVPTTPTHLIKIIIESLQNLLSLNIAHVRQGIYGRKKGWFGFNIWKIKGKRTSENIKINTTLIEY